MGYTARATFSSWTIFSSRSRTQCGHNVPSPLRFLLLTENHRAMRPRAHVFGARHAFNSPPLRAETFCSISYSPHPTRRIYLPGAPPPCVFDVRLDDQHPRNRSRGIQRESRDSEEDSGSYEAPGFFAANHAFKWTDRYGTPAVGGVKTKAG